MHSGYKPGYKPGWLSCRASEWSAGVPGLTPDPAMYF